MLVRLIKPLNGSSNCRVCNRTLERIEHFAYCPGMNDAFKPFITLVRAFNIQGPYDSALRLLGCVRSPTDDDNYITIPQGLFTTLLILWKFIILMLTEVDTHGAKFSSDRIWRLTCTRLAERLNALRYSYQLRLRKADLRGEPKPNPNKISRHLAPLATITASGSFVYAQPFIDLMKHHLGDNLRLECDEPPTDLPTQPNYKPIQFVLEGSLPE